MSPPTLLGVCPLVAKERGSRVWSIAALLVALGCASVAMLVGVRAERRDAREPASTLPVARSHHAPSVSRDPWPLAQDDLAQASLGRDDVLGLRMQPVTLALELPGLPRLVKGPLGGGASAWVLRPRAYAADTCAEAQEIHVPLPACVPGCVPSCQRCAQRVSSCNCNSAGFPESTRALGILEYARDLSWPGNSRPAWLDDPLVIRNDLVFGAETTARTVYLSIAFVTLFARADASSANAYDDVLRAILLHEYGHWLDLAFARHAVSTPSASVCNALSLPDDGSEHHHEELWADAVAGCLFARTLLTQNADRGDVAARQSLERMLGMLYQEGCDAPDAGARSQAIETGWNRCSDDRDSPITTVLSIPRGN